jgi:Ca-activated chloride channel homolog
MTRCPLRRSAETALWLLPLALVGLLLPAAFSGFAATAAVQAPVAQDDQQRPAFRAGVELVSLSVTVTDLSNRFVTTLGMDDFSVFEDGMAQEVTFFNRTNLPVALSLLLDTSASMENRLATVQRAAVGFASRIREQDMAQVVDFDSRVTVLESFTNDPAALERAIMQTTAGGSTSLYNALYIALHELRKVRAKTAEEIRRQAIVVLSDGEDTSSLVTFDRVLDLAKRSETAIYAIGLRSADTSKGRGFREADYVLRQLANETGGRAFFPTKAEDLGDIYDRIGQELSSQYLIGYTSRNPRRDGAWRRVVVRVNKPELTTRTKQGYYAPVVQ